MSHGVCPWWLGYFLASPLRKLGQAPHKIIAPYVQPGMTVVDVGSAMGFFTLPLARLVGENGRVVALDVQKKMLASLERRAKRAGLAERTEPRLCPADSLGITDLAGQADFALAFAVVHELPDAGHAFAEIFASLKAGAQFLIAEPKGHVNVAAFSETVRKAESCGFKVVISPQIARSHAALMRKDPGTK